MGKRLAILVVVSLLGCASGHWEKSTVVEKRWYVDVGPGPADLELFDGGRRLVSTNDDDNTVSVVDLEAGTELARVRIPVTERDAGGELTHGDPSGTSVDEAGGRTWVVTTEGRSSRSTSGRTPWRRASPIRT